MGSSSSPKGDTSIRSWWNFAAGWALLDTPDNIAQFTPDVFSANHAIRWQISITKRYLLLARLCHFSYDYLDWFG
jgi:hypothetical protein